jgi:hypothetical protein
MPGRSYDIVDAPQANPERAGLSCGPRIPPANLAPRPSQLKSGVAIYGGFAGTETSRDGRNPAANVTVPSGDLNGDDGANFANNGENSYHVVTGADRAILDGVTTSGGNANGTGGSDDELGGGMYNSHSSAALTGVAFSGNRAGRGGGMYNDSSSPALNRVTFNGNSAGTGGAMHNHSSSPTLTNATFSGNSASSGGGMYSRLSSSPRIRNTILWGDTGGELVSEDSTSAPTITYSVVQGGCPAGATCTNLIDTDPLPGALGDYGGATQTIPLLLGSSAVDAGDDSLCPATDQRGVARPQGAHCDIGALEKELATVALSDVSNSYDGQGKSPTVTTDPAGLAVDVTYNGLADRPVNAGDYAVVAIINDVRYMGSASATLTVHQSAVTVTADARTKHHGEPDPALTYQLTSGSLVSGDAFSGALARSAGEAVGTYSILQGTLALTGNYLLTYVPGNCTVLPACERRRYARSRHDLRLHGRAERVDLRLRLGQGHLHQCEPGGGRHSHDQDYRYGQQECEDREGVGQQRSGNQRDLRPRDDEQYGRAEDAGRKVVSASASCLVPEPGRRTSKGPHGGCACNRFL